MNTASPRRQTSERRSREEQPCCLSWLWTEARAIFKPKVRKWQPQLCLKPKASKAVTMFESKKEKTWGLLFVFISHVLNCYCVTMPCAPPLYNSVSPLCTHRRLRSSLSRPPLPPLQVIPEQELSSCHSAAPHGLPVSRTAASLPQCSSSGLSRSLLPHPPTRVVFSSFLTLYFTTFCLL